MRKCLISVFGSIAMVVANSVLSAELPQSHPAFGLKSGEYRIVHGAIIQRPRSASDKVLALTGVAEEIVRATQPILLKLSDEDLPDHERRKAERQLILELIGYWIDPLSSDQKAELKAMYVKHLSLFEEKAQRIGEVLKSCGEMYKLDEKYKCEKELNKTDSEIFGPFVEEIAEVLLTELQIYSKSQVAWERRFGTWRPGFKMDPQSARPMLAKAIANLVAGNYIPWDQEREKRQAADDSLDKSNEEKKPQIDWPERTQFFPEPKQVSLGNWRYPKNQKETTRTRVVNHVEGPVEAVGWEVRVFSAEHPIINSDAQLMMMGVVTANFAVLDALGVVGSLSGTDLLGFLRDVGLVHTSVVAGLWKSVRRQVQETVEIQVFLNGEWTTKSSQQIKRTVNSTEFDSWQVANGSASWINTGEHPDVYKLKLLATFDNFADAKHWLFTPLPTSDGVYRRMRACTYATGNYGLNWVCHQNSNCFAFRRWGILPALYPISLLPYSLFGNGIFLGCSKRKDPIAPLVEHNTGGVPGKPIFYHLTPPYALPVLWAHQSLFMSKAGHHLEQFWSPNKRQYLDSECAYLDKAIPVVGGDDALDNLGR